MNQDEQHTVARRVDEQFMESDAQTVPTSKRILWAGRIISAVMKLVKPPEVVEGFTRVGYADRLALGIGILELVCADVYVIPRTSILGAILLTGYLGGATATHVRIGEPFFAPIILGVLVWEGFSCGTGNWGNSFICDVRGNMS